MGLSNDPLKMPPWRVLLLQPASSYLERLSPEQQRRIVEAVDNLAKDPRSVTLRRLHGRPEWRLRVGPWRALIRMEEKSRTLIVTRIGPRGDIYDR
jgi:mRNA interferase RelE/StbE